jgi:arsenate reductase-like glutaredoxin family protein
MTSATHADVCRLFPGLQDHAIVDLLATRPSIAELEAVSQLLQDDDESLIEIKQRKGARLNRLMAILSYAQVHAADNHDR